MIMSIKAASRSYAVPLPRGRCACCGRAFQVTTGGKIRRHYALAGPFRPGDRRTYCDGSGRAPA
jgi:hypothetical protein